MAIYSWFTYWTWWFTIAMLNYQRGNGLKVMCQSPRKNHGFCGGVESCWRIIILVDKFYVKCIIKFCSMFYTISSLSIYIIKYCMLIDNSLMLAENKRTVIFLNLLEQNPRCSLNKTLCTSLRFYLISNWLIAPCTSLRFYLISNWLITPCTSLRFYLISNWLITPCTSLRFFLISNWLITPCTSLRFYDF